MMERYTDTVQALQERKRKGPVKSKQSNGESKDGRERKAIECTLQRYGRRFSNGESPNLHCGEGHRRPDHEENNAHKGCHSQNKVITSVSSNTSTH